MKGLWAIRLFIYGHADPVIRVFDLRCCNTGYLSYSSANVLKRFFKRLGDYFGWAGLDDSNDCAGIVREVYHCFDFELPCTLTTSSLLRIVAVTNLSECIVEEKLVVLPAMILRSPLQMPNHKVLCLGLRDGVPYGISAIGNVTKQDAEGYGALRGIHFQNAPYASTCIEG